MPNKGTPRPRWTKEEDEVVLALYPDVEACEGRLADMGSRRSRQMISKRARMLGAASRNEPWSDEENEIMATVYPYKGVDATMEALKEAGYVRTRSSIASHANNIGIQRDESSIDSRWSEEEISVVKRLYSSHTALQVSRKLKEMGYDRSPYAVSARARLLGVERNPIRRRERKGELKVLNFVLDTEIDSDVIDILAGKQNRSDYLRRLVREDAAR